MAMYVDYLSENNKSATIRRRVNSLGTVLKLSKNFDHTKDPEAILALKRMHRKIGRAQQQATPLTRPLLNQLLSNCDNNVMGVRNQAFLRLGCETTRRRAELRAFKFEDICKGTNGKSAIRLNVSKTDQFGTGKIVPISQELFDLLKKWRSMISDEGYILRSVTESGYIGSKRHRASVSTLLKALQKDLKMDSDEPPLSGHSFRVGAALDLLEQDEGIERIMLRGGWQTDSTAMKCFRNWVCNN